ncbi:N(2),N(2)-dimethylguanosine tRNA methyltransferase [Echinococcus granulosus]|uniref:tRNA (guanine(26)-N(2))-dimethyltransferase n=1 Tax=Echinococcus granulosus TaxID=6210 RepID=W6UU77_ECHGR|nr:N(2),N(2)-dimethylguanosine tRNA methyltransferase [Echinococcus granulosus]EUB61922.1 N(2),N(2)-dimethylguanosine tRNA methyltransferase [Echinococcus granulosus]
MGKREFGPIHQVGKFAEEEGAITLVGGGEGVSLKTGPLVPTARTYHHGTCVAYVIRTTSMCCILISSVLVYFYVTSLSLADMVVMATLLRSVMATNRGESQHTTSGILSDSRALLGCNRLICLLMLQQEGGEGKDEVRQCISTLKDKFLTARFRGVVRSQETVTIPEWLTLAEGVRSHPLTEKIVVPGTLDRLIGVLSVATEELPDCPLYFQSDRLCATLRTVVPKIALIRSARLSVCSTVSIALYENSGWLWQACLLSALLNAGYRVSFSHAALSSIKTDAPMSFIWDVMCAWKRKHEAEVRAQKRLRSPTPPPPREGDNVEIGDDEKTTESKKQNKCGRKHPPSEAALRVVDRLMSRPPNPAISFDPHPDANPPSRASGLLRQVAA